MDPYRQYWSPYVGMGNNPVSNVDPDGGCVDGQGNVIPCPYGVSDGLNGQHTVILGDAFVNGGGVLGDQSAAQMSSLTNASSECHSCSNAQHVTKTGGLPLLSDATNLGGFAASLALLSNLSPQAKLTTNTIMYTGILTDVASKEMGNTQDQVDFILNTASTMAAAASAASAPVAVYVNYASAHKETVIEVTENLTKGYHINYERTQETTNQHLRIQQEMSRKIMQQRQQNGGQ